MFGPFAAITWTLAPRLWAATRARAIAMSLKDQVAIRIVPLLGSGSLLRSRGPPHTPWIVNRTRLRMANRSALLAFGRPKLDPGGIT